QDADDHEPVGRMLPGLVRQEWHLLPARGTGWPPEIDEDRSTTEGGQVERRIVERPAAELRDREPPGNGRAGWLGQPDEADEETRRGQGDRQQDGDAPVRPPCSEDSGRYGGLGHG